MDLPPPTGLYVPIHEYFCRNSSKRRARPLVNEEYLYLNDSHKPGQRRRFKLYKDKALNFNTEKLHKNLVQRYRDDDYETDDDIMKGGMRRINSDLDHIFNELLVIGTSPYSLVRNLRRSRR